MPALGFVLALAGAAPGQAIELRVELGKSLFFEDEPIYAVFELRNPGADTVWVDLFGLAYRNLTTQLFRDGRPLAEDLYVADYFPGSDWRGVAIPPGSALYDTAVLQDWWGTRDADSREVFLHRLEAGAYELTARYISNIPSGNPIRADGGPVRFEIRPRTAEDDVSFRQFERVRRMAWNSSQRSNYLPEVLAGAEARLAANPADPYLAFLLRNGIQTAQAIGQQPDSGAARRIARLRGAVAEAQRSLPSGAVVVDALFLETPQEVSSLVEGLTGSIAGRVAAARLERRAGHLPF